MKNCSLYILFLIVLSSDLIAQAYPKAILRGDYPDPTIIRDGKDFYMTHSPFVYSGGFLIWHSTDLVNWNPLVRTQTNIKGSAYAPDLVKHDGKYYIYYPSNGTNWVIWADEITGPWSEPIDLQVERIDPGHVVGQEGERYLHLSKGMMIALAEDGLSTKGELFKTYEGWEYPSDWDTECFCLESPKLSYKDGYYYLTSAQGGTAGPATSHMVVSARSKSVNGPWENSPYNPIVHTYSPDEQWWSKGHGTLIDDTKGNWWIVYHAYEKEAHTLGRQTLLDPIKWTEDGWFKLDPERKPLSPKREKSGMKLSDDFAGDLPAIQWMAWGKIDEKEAGIENGKLLLKGKGTQPGDGNKWMVTVPDRSYQIQVEVNLEHHAEGGLILFYRENAYAGVVSDGAYFYSYQHAKKENSVPNPYGHHFFLKIINQEDICSLHASSDGVHWITIADTLDVSGLHHNNYRGFYALRPGLVVTGTAEIGFDNFMYEVITSQD